MSKYTMKVAIDHGKNLPSFPELESARAQLFEYRDMYLTLLFEACQKQDGFNADYESESLKTLESWYFKLWESQSFWDVGMARSEFEIAMAMYFGEVMVQHGDGFEWIVEEFAFQPGKFEIGVRKDRLTVMLSRFTDLFARPSNKKRQSIWREYKKYIGSGKK